MRTDVCSPIQAVALLAGRPGSKRLDQLQSLNTGKVYLHVVLSASKLYVQAVRSQKHVLLLLQIAAMRST